MAYLSTKIEGGGDVETSIRNRKLFKPAWLDPFEPNPAATKAMLQAEYGTRESSPPNVVPAAKSISFLVCVRWHLLFVFYIEPPHFPGRLNRSRGNYLIYVETTGFHGSGHAVDTMDAISKAPSLPVKIYLDEIDKLGNYECILP